MNSTKARRYIIRIFQRTVAMLWLCLCCATAHAGQQHYNVDSLLSVLDAVIDSSEVYNRQLQHELIQYRKRYDNATSREASFAIAHELFLHYRKYRLDSALHYARQRVKMAADFGEPDSLSSARLDEADALKCLGRLHDALHILEKIPHTPYISNNAHYYYLYHSILLSLSQMTTDPDEMAYYRPLLMRYRDTVNMVNRDDPLTVCVNTSEIEKSQGRVNQALEELLRFGQQNKDMVQQSAIYWYVLGETYRDIGDNQGAKYCFTMSSIIDKRNCNKTYTSLQSLAWMLYNEGDTERAYHYITCSLGDVMASNARSRLSLVSEYLPIITAAYEQKQYTSAMRRNILIGAALIAAIILSIMLWILHSRSKRLALMHHELAEGNGKLLTLNSRLENLNRDLVESNLIKEEYIGQLFNLCSGYINEAEKNRVKMLAKLKSGKTDEVERQLDQSTMKEDLSKLFYHFDMIFLQLFPDFIERFNALLRPGEQIEVKGDNLLSPELRIYALVRLGINDSTKIASFLHYSPQTVYNYRMKTRNRSNIPKDEFASRVQRL
ncbi:MAG: hypothetical protein IJJ83_10165 [Muribaculaceae bacterium]|nr:hypothetical protein [Muribaculaceae bacterium]